MTESQLIQHISTFDKRIRMVKLRSKLKEQNFSLSELVDLTFYPDKQIAIKASKIMQYIVFKFAENYTDDIAYLLAHVTDVKLLGCKKHYAKIIMHLTSPEVAKDVRTVMKGIDLEPVVELCFDWINDPKMLTGVRASAAEALFNMRHRYPWIAERLSCQLEAMMLNATPMFRARGNYILGFLHCED
ncbi:MAG TPA: hypothetical protein VHE59_12845 [Mucilaginibacter sp.]|nr:hypothetical protein [Mucilaginibacter sp.]